jgi:hypothetical protein
VEPRARPACEETRPQASVENQNRARQRAAPPDPNQNRARQRAAPPNPNQNRARQRAAPPNANQNRARQRAAPLNPNQNRARQRADAAIKRSGSGSQVPVWSGRSPRSRSGFNPAGQNAVDGTSAVTKCEVSNRGCTSGQAVASSRARSEAKPSEVSGHPWRVWFWPEPRPSGRGRLAMAPMVKGSGGPLADARGSDAMRGPLIDVRGTRDSVAARGFGFFWRSRS